MRVFITGKTGFVGRHVVALLQQHGHQLCGLTENPHAMIHLAWAGLPNYEDKAHYYNVQWQFELIKIAEQLGVRNITVAGTCLEDISFPLHYAVAKSALHAALNNLDITLKWVRLPYIHGDGQRPECLLPSLRRAIINKDPEFHVIDTKLSFLDVKQAAGFLITAMKDDRAQVMNCPGALEKVSDFCRRHIPPGCDIKIIEDYPLKPWEV